MIYGMNFVLFIFVCVLSHSIFHSAVRILELRQQLRRPYPVEPPQEINEPHLVSCMTCGGVVDMTQPLDIQQHYEPGHAKPVAH